MTKNPTLFIKKERHLPEIEKHMAKKTFKALP